jgi:hypothetical protein
VDIVLLTERYAAQIAGVLSCWDRVLVFGTLPKICFAEGTRRPGRRLTLKTAVAFRSEWPTVSNQKGLQTLKESPFWFDAEQCKVLPGDPLGAFLRSPMIKADAVCVCETKTEVSFRFAEIASWRVGSSLFQSQTCSGVPDFS